MMSLKIVTLVSLFSILFGSVLCQASNLELSVYGGSNQWWIAVTVTGGAATTSTIELQQQGSSTWTEMNGDSNWGYWQLGSRGSYNGFKFPLSFRLTSSTGEQLVLSSILSSVSGGSENIPTQVQYTSGTSTHAPTSAPTHQATVPPTSAPTSAPTHQATVAPTSAPTHQATVAPTHSATVAPTHSATVAPTSAPTAAPTHKATVAPTSAPTSAPTQKATKAPTVAPTSAPTTKATVKPTTPASTNLCAVTSAVTEPVKFLVPLYIYPGSTWTQVASAAQAGLQVIAIINPDNGPDSSGPDSSYTTYMAQLTAAGVTMVGYIHTSYGDRAIADVTADIATYATKYPGLAGIFVDECATSASDVSYYTQVYNAVTSHAGYVNTIINPGTQPDEGYLAVSTNIVIFEDVASAWTGNLFSSWVSCAPSAAAKPDYKYKFSAISYATSAAQMATLIPEFAAAGIGMVYATDGAAGGNTYNTLPSYFSTEITAIAALN